MGVAEFAVHTDVCSGLGSLDRLGALLERHSAGPIVVAVDAALAESGVLEFVLSHVPATPPVSVSAFSSNPDPEAVDEAAAKARAAGAQSVLAIGGGSALGAGKALAILLTNPGPIADYEGAERVPTAPAPTVAVPTTAGSGSEVSNALVLHAPSRPNELVIRGRGYEPRAAVLDGRVLRRLPASPMLYAGLDALTHCMEALWARGRSFFTTQLALRSADRILDLLPDAVRAAEDGRNASGANDEVLQELLEASCAANMACGNSGLGLVHALSSAMAVELPHGLQNGVLLPHVARYNADVLPEEAQPLVARIALLYETVGFEASFRAVTTKTVPAEAMIRVTAGHPFRANNLRTATDDDLEELLRAAGADLREMRAR